MVAKQASSPATPPGMDVTRLVEFFHRRAETCATSKPIPSALKTDCCWATDPVNNGRIAPASPPGRSFRLPNSSHQDAGNSATACGLSASPLGVDAVEKRLAIIGFAIGGRFRSILGRALPPDRRTPEPTCQASYAIDAHTPSVGGPSRRSAIVLRFCTMAAR